MGGRGVPRRHHAASDRDLEGSDRVREHNAGANSAIELVGPLFEDVLAAVSGITDLPVARGLDLAQRDAGNDRDHQVAVVVETVPKGDIDHRPRGGQAAEVLGFGICGTHSDSAVQVVLGGEDRRGNEDGDRSDRESESTEIHWGFPS